MTRKQVVVPADAPDWAKRLQPDLDRLADGKVATTDLPSGTVIGRAFASYTANADIDATIPLDDTSPAVDEGVEVVSKAYTPQATDSRLSARFKAFGGCDTAGVVIVAAMFDGSTCIDATAVTPVGANELTPLSLEAEWTPGDVDEHTISVRIGSETGDTVRLNGNASGRLFGGAAVAPLIIEEIK